MHARVIRRSSGFRQRKTNSLGQNGACFCLLYAVRLQAVKSMYPDPAADQNADRVAAGHELKHNAYTRSASRLWGVYL